MAWYYEINTGKESSELEAINNHLFEVTNYQTLSSLMQHHLLFYNCVT
jgi:hypothetical protein